MSCLYGQHILMELIVEFADTIIAKKNYSHKKNTYATILGLEQILKG